MATDNGPLATERIPTGGNQKPDGRSNKRSRIPPPKAPPTITISANLDSLLLSQDPSAHLSDLEGIQWCPPGLSSPVERQAASNLCPPFRSSSPPGSNTSFGLEYYMGSVASPREARAMQPQKLVVKHERTSSISSVNMPTPVSMSGPRSPMLSPRHRSPRQLSEDHSSSDEHGVVRFHSYKRAEEPRRNHEAKIFCKHQECTGLIFDCKCEWSKHMDKHDRPYKCLAEGCEKLQGFTYSGGLLRHEREIHNKYGRAKKPIFCPFTDCKHNSGAGFTWKENLAEHIRRVHRRTSTSVDMHGLVVRRETLESSEVVENSASPHTHTEEHPGGEELTLKRKRTADLVPSDSADEDLKATVKRLRQESKEKDARLQQLQQAVLALQQNRG